MSIQLSPRHHPVSEGRHEISTAVSAAIKAHDLTYAEITSILADEMRAWAGYNMKDEREQAEKNEQHIQ
jgi:hypothetical protein